MPASVQPSQRNTRQKYYFSGPLAHTQSPRSLRGPRGFSFACSPKEFHVFSSLLSNAARFAVLPASVGPWAAILVPVLLYVATHRDVTLNVR
jgi:hypothetical protein